MQFHHFVLMFCQYGLFVACSFADLHFPREEVLTPELMPLQGITSPLRVEVKHPFLILQNMKQTDSLFHIYNLANYELKNTFGIKGEGPDEFVLPWLLQTQLSTVFIEDRHSLHQFDIDEEGLPVFKGIKQPNHINEIYEAAFINDSLYVVDAMYTAPCLYLLTLQDELPKKSWQYRNPGFIDYYADPAMGRVYANESRIIFCYGYKKQIDFMDIEFNLIKSVKFKYIPSININSENQGDVKMSYVHSYLGKRYLYSLFLGISWNEHRAQSTHGTILEVYDLSGNPVARYQLAGRRPVYFAVDEETFMLYGAGDDGDPENYLLVYKLKGLS